MKRLVMTLAWQLFRAGFGSHSDCLRESWKRSRKVPAPQNHLPEWTYKRKPVQVVTGSHHTGPDDLRQHLPDRGKSAKSSSVYRKVRIDYESGSIIQDTRSDLSQGKSAIKSANRISNRSKFSGPPKGFYTSQRLVGDYQRNGFRIQ